MPDLGGDTPLESCIREARKAGYAGIELGNKFPRDAAMLRPCLEAQGLSPVFGWYSARPLERSAERTGLRWGRPMRGARPPLCVCSTWSPYRAGGQYRRHVTATGKRDPGRGRCCRSELSPLLPGIASGG